MKPDIRPVSILTRAILDTSSHWCFIGLNSSSGEVLQAERLWVLNGVVTKGAPMRGAVNAMPKSATCYPCKADAPFEPIPWPVLPGEVEIPQWRGKTTALTGDIVDIINDCYWWTDSKGQNHSVTFRVDERPAPRRQINPDGTETPVWVWEKDV